MKIDVGFRTNFAVRMASRQRSLQSFSVSFSGSESLQGQNSKILCLAKILADFEMNNIGASHRLNSVMTLTHVQFAFALPRSALLPLP